MQKLTFLLPALFATLLANAQSPVKRYVTIEHFTNSRCSICASKNPAFYNTIDDYPNDIHHISIHPSVPYNTCVFYLANTAENNALTAIYGISGTPRVALNGVLAAPSSQLLPLATLQAQLNQTSPLLVQVNETTGNSRTATIRLRTQAAIPGGTYKLYAAIVEKTINQVTPNGEGVHHDVFRKMLTPMNGVDYTPAALGQEVTFSYNYDIANNWNASEIYVLAYVRNTATGETLNSGTRFDPIILSAAEAKPSSIQLTPNPTNGVAFANIGDDVAQCIEVFDSAGRRVTAGFEHANSGQVAIQLDGLARGFYIVLIRGEKARYVAKVVKE